MIHNPNENDDDNRTAASVVKIEQPDEVPGLEAQQQEHFDLHQNPLLDWTLKTESTSASADNDGNDLKELKVMIANLEIKNQALQGKVENLESKAENRALKENVEQKANYQALETKLRGEFAEMLATQNEQHQTEIEQLKYKFSQMLADQQKQKAQFQAQFNALEQKLKEADQHQHAQVENNEVEEIIQANQQEMQLVGIEMDENEMPQSEEGDEEEVEDEEEYDDEHDQNEEEEAIGEEDEDDEGGQPPRNITKKMKGKEKKYRLLKTVKSMYELDKFRYKKYCQYFGRKPQQISKSKVMPCMNKKYGKTCEFELMAVRSAELDSGKIHIYAHSHHSNHPLERRTKHRTYRVKREMQIMPDANPPAIYRTPPDNVKWSFQGTFPDNGKLDEFRYENDCNPTADRGGSRFRFYCRCRYTNECNFMLLAMKTTKQRYHVYKHGEHIEHSARKPIKDQTEDDEDDDCDYEEEEADEEEEREEEEEDESEAEDSEEDDVEVLEE